MKNKIFLSAILVGAMFLAAGCTKTETDSPARDAAALERIGVEVAGHTTRAIYAVDPTMSNVPTRAEAGHVLSVGIGGGTFPYKYVSGAWVPESATAIFPGYGESEIALTLEKEGAVQDGTAAGLLDADRLTYTATVSPTRELRGIEMTHARTLVEVELDGELVIDEGTTIKVDNSITYNIPNTKKYQAIIDAGVDGFNISLTKDGVDYVIYTQKAQVSDGEFRANFRYSLVLTDIGKAISLTAIVLTPWSEAGTGTAVPLTEGRISFANGYTAGTNVKVVFEKGGETTLEFNNSQQPLTGSYWGLGNDVVKSIQVGSHPEIMIGRAVGETVTLALTGGGAGVSLRQDGSSRYLIGTIAEFRASETLPSASFLQEADIYLMKLDWTPVFDYLAEPANQFKGTFDGNGKKIHDIFYNAGRGALFLGNEGTIKNVYVASGSIGNRGFINTAGICVYNMVGGTIENCTNEAMIGANSWAAGICAINEGTVRGCVNRGQIIAFGDAGFANSGGIVGSNGMEAVSLVENCTNYGTLNCTGNNVGGISSTTFKGILRGCTNEGAVNGNGYVGGITGDLSNVAENCTNKGVVKATLSCGGIVGIPYIGAKIRRCTNSGSVTATGIANVGGITSSTSLAPDIEITECLNSGAITSTGSTGGIIGYHTNGTLAACVNTGTVSSSGDRVGGIVGDNMGGVITACYNRSTRISSSANLVGGIAGYSWTGAVIEACYSVGTVAAANGRTGFGGIVGENQ
jgi:hypothetical protein